jgi:hypothetical protein
MTQADAVLRFETEIAPGGILMSQRSWLHELRGKNLACWCKLDEACHADVLLRLANQ